MHFQLPYYDPEAAVKLVPPFKPALWGQAVTAPVAPDHKGGENLASEPQPKIWSTCSSFVAVEALGFIVKIDRKWTPSHKKWQKDSALKLHT